MVWSPGIIEATGKHTINGVVTGFMGYAFYRLLFRGEIGEDNQIAGNRPFCVWF